MTLILNSCLNNDLTGNFDKEGIPEKFANSSLTERHGEYMFSLYYKDSTIEFFLAPQKDGYKILNKVVNEEDFKRNNFYRPDVHFSDKEVEDLFQDYLSLMKDLSILSYTSEFNFAGFDIKLTMTDGSQYYYVSDVSNITNENWKSLFQSLIKVDDDWYLVGGK